MAISVSASDRDSATVVKITGRVLLYDGSKEMYEAVDGQLQRGRKRIVLDLSEVSYIDSSGLGFLVTAYTKVKNSGGELVVAAPQAKVRDLMEGGTKLYLVIGIYDTVDEAVASLEKRS